jgi:hypothetical protein
MHHQNTACKSELSLINKIHLLVHLKAVLAQKIKAMSMHAIYRQRIGVKLAANKGRCRSEPAPKTPDICPCAASESADPQVIDVAASNSAVQDVALHDRRWHPDSHCPRHGTKQMLLRTAGCRAPKSSYQTQRKPICCSCHTAVLRTPVLIPCQCGQSAAGMPDSSRAPKCLFSCGTWCRNV